MKRILIFVFALLFISLTYAQTWSNLGPDGGFFKDFIIHPTNPNIVYAGSDDGGGVWKTTNGGDSWELLTGDFPNFTGWHIEMDQQHPDTLYFCEIYGRYGILKTMDGGATIEHHSAGFIFNKDFQTTQLAIYSGSGDTLFASTGEGDDYGRIGNGVFSSYDGGENWNYSGLQGISVHCIRIADNDRILAGTDTDGLWYSDDIGEVWVLHPDIPDTATILQMDKMNGVIVVSAAANGVFASYDNGTTFTYIGLYGEFNFDLSILATTPYLEVISTGFFHPNRFTSETGLWSPISDPLLEDQILIGVESKEDIIYAGIFSSTQIIKSTDNGASWAKLEVNPIATEIRAVVVDPSSDKIYTSLQNSYNLSGDRYNTESISMSADGGSTWTRTGPLAHGMDLVLHPTETETLFLGTFAQGLFKTTNDFETWENCRAGNKLILDVVINPDNSDELLLSELNIPTLETGIFKSVNGGDSWYETGDIIANHIVYSTDNDFVYFSNENGIYVSEDNGETIGATPIYLDDEAVLSLAYHSPFLYAGTEEGQLYKIDSDGLIENISGDWNTDRPKEIRNIAYVQNSLIIGLNGAEQDTLHNLNGGVWQSINEGESWIEITTNLTNTNVFSNTGIALANDNQLIIAAYGQGIFKSSDLVLSVLEEKETELTISIFPNPTSNFINIQSGSQKNIDKISIHTLDGKTVYSKTQGLTNTVLINDLSIADGMYMITITIDGNTYTSKIIIQASN